MYDESSMIIDKRGDKIWKDNLGRFHRLDGPAVEYADGEKSWYKNGLKHRLDGPAVERSDGTRHWYKDGNLHRLDGPAVMCDDGYKGWYKDGCFFRSKDAFFESLTEEEKELTLFSEDFLNG